MADENANRLARYIRVPDAHDVVETARHDDVDWSAVVETLDALDRGISLQTSKSR